MEFNFNVLPIQLQIEIRNKLEETTTQQEFFEIVTKFVDCIEQNFPYYFWSACGLLWSELQNTNSPYKHHPYPSSWNDCVFYYGGFKIAHNKMQKNNFYYDKISKTPFC